MAERGEHSLHEITTQTESWQDAIDTVQKMDDALLMLMERNTDRRVLFIGCGSTYYLTQFAASYFQSVTGLSCRALPSSELYLFTEAAVTADEPPLWSRALSLGRNQRDCNGRAKDARAWKRYAGYQLLRAHRSQPPPHMTVAVRQGQEKSYAQTRSFAGMLVAVQAMAAVVSEDETLMNELCLLPEVGQHLIRRSGPMAKSYCKERYKRITYLGSFALYGLAGEAMIKMKEMSLSTAEAFHFMEFRHGPIALVDDEHLIVGLLSDSAREYELGVLRDLRARGGHTLAMGQDVDPLLGEVGSVFDLYAPKVSERARAVLYLPLLQLLAYYRAMARELDPDRPRNVEMAIRLDGTKMAAS